MQKNEEIKKILEEIEEIVIEILSFSDTEINSKNGDFIVDYAYKIKELIKKIKENDVG